jgi:GNAT superfamily N-acetyltransferase
MSEQGQVVAVVEALKTMKVTRPTLSQSESFQLIAASELATAPIDLVRTPIDGGFMEQTRSRPSYWHGNRIVLDAAPDPADYPRWLATYGELFAWRTDASPAVITWYERYDVRPEAQADERVVRHTGLLAPLVPSDPPRPTGLQSSTVDSGELWRALAALSERVYPEHGAHNRWRIQTLRELQDRDLGRVRVLLDAAGTPVCAVGAFARNGVARFSGVITDPSYRQRGCASYLIAATLRDQRDLSTRIVICAKADSAGERLYLRLGFEPFVTIRSLMVTA